jgi:ribosomal protein L40E
MTAWRPGMPFVVCEECGQVVSAAAEACRHCARAGVLGETRQLKHVVALLGLSMIAGCPPGVSAKYGAEVVDSSGADTDDTEVVETDVAGRED